MMSNSLTHYLFAWVSPPSAADQLCAGAHLSGGAGRDRRHAVDAGRRVLGRALSQSARSGDRAAACGVRAGLAALFAQYGLWTWMRAITESAAYRRTPFVQTLYDEAIEVPMFDDGCELAHKILHYLDRPDERRAMASAAQQRAVPAYSIEARAAEVTAHLRSLSAGDRNER